MADAMADATRMALAELRRKAEAEPGLDVPQEGVRVLAEALMELEVEQHLGADRHERTGEREGYRNGTRERTRDTRGARSRRGCRGGGTAALCRACWRRARAASGRWWRWCGKPLGEGSPRGGSMRWSRRCGWRA